MRDLSQAQKRNSYLTSPKQTKKEEAGEKAKAPEERKEEEKKAPETEKKE